MLPIAALLTAPRAARRLLLTACLLAPAALPLTACGSGSAAAEQAKTLPLTAVLPGSWQVVAGPAAMRDASVTFKTVGTPNFLMLLVRPGRSINLTGDFGLSGSSRIEVKARGFVGPHPLAGTPERLDATFDVTVASRDSITLTPMGGGEPLVLSRGKPIRQGGPAGGGATP